jgi:hypothetical protein
LVNGRIAELAARGEPRIRRRNTSLAQLARAQFKVHFHLLA